MRPNNMRVETVIRVLTAFENTEACEKGDKERIGTKEQAACLCVDASCGKLVLEHHHQDAEQGHD